MMNSDIFLKIKQNDNLLFSKLNKKDLLELVYYISLFCPTLRENIGLTSDDTFGLEIEFENIKNKALLGINMEDNYPEWMFKADLSLFKGAEVCSPCMRDERKNWMDLLNVCEIIKRNATIGNRSGGHIHVGAQIFDGIPDYLIRFIKLWSVYENVIFRFAYGEYLSGRMSIREYASPCSLTLWDNYEIMSSMGKIDLDDILNLVTSTKRSQAVNFKNVRDIANLSDHNTVEFRCPNGTMNAIVWQNNVNFFVKLLKCSKSIQYDDDILMRRRSINKGIYSDLKMYDEIFLEQALELADMVFSNNIDKVYFLHQYLKQFDISNDCKKKVRSL